MRWDLYVWNKFRVTSSLSCLDVRPKSFRVYQSAVILVCVSLITDRTVYETLIPERREAVNCFLCNFIK